MYVNIHFIRHKEQSRPFLDPPANAVREVMVFVVRNLWNTNIVQ